jgi:hypothetical protein
LFYFQLNGKFFSKRRKKRKELIFWFLLKEWHFIRANPR